MLAAAGALSACASSPSSDAAYSHARLQGCALDQYGGCPDAPYAPVLGWPYIYYPVAVIPVYPVVPVYPPLPTPPPKQHRRPPVRNHCEKPTLKKPANGCP